MWIVKVALERPYTFIVLALLLLILGPLTILRTPTDIFPNIGIPVVSVVWKYSGLTSADMGNRVVSNFERALTTTVNDIEHIESQSLTGTGVVKIFFQPNANIDVALSQVTAIAQTLLFQLPPGTTPPLVISYSASTVPVIQLALSSQKLPEQELFDLGNSFIRTQLATVQGAALPFPYGGKVRQVQVDLDLAALRARGLTPQDVNAAISSQNLILPAGTEKIGEFEYNIMLNASPSALEDLNDLPVKSEFGATIYVHDVAHVRDGNAPQTNIVRVNGERAVLMAVQKTGNASTLDIIKRVKERLPAIRAGMPPELTIKAIGDQSFFVSAAVEGVIHEGVIAAALTGLMILLFLGSWRSTLIITVSIPLSILASIVALAAFGQTINVMTLGGLALAVGILVDDATVAVENINWHLEQGKAVVPSILDGAHQIAVPALVSTLCICIVFVPMFFLSGVARFLFVPMAEAVVFAMLASYVLSRTLVPTMAMYLLKPHDHHTLIHRSKNVLTRFQAGFERRFEATRDGYRSILIAALTKRRIAIAAFLLLSGGSMLLVPFLGEDFFPSVDGGEMKLHMRARSGTRIEEMARLCDEVENTVKTIIPASEVLNIADNIGLPVSGINLTYSNSAPVGPADADILISLTQGHKPTAGYVRQLRKELPRLFPGVTFAFLPADIVSQILNFGLPSPIDIQVVGFKLDGNRQYAAELMDRFGHIPGIADLRIQQAYDYPELHVDVDRSRAEDLGLSELNVANNLLVALSGSFQTQPSFWLNPKTGVTYPVVAQAPQYTLDSLQALEDLPIDNPANSQGPKLLRSVAHVSRGVGQSVASHYNVQPVIDIFAATEGRDLGGVGHDIQKILEQTAPHLPKGSSVVARGQMQTMASSFNGLFAGLAFAIVLVYLLIVVNFQSWLDPFIIITALPVAIAGIVWMLFVTHTTMSVPALTGAIMCMGVATANSILVVSFAREKLAETGDPFVSALEAGFGRFRPVLMTALAMVIGMVPMALGFGQGGEQNAPLGRAVIGGLLFATAATLVFVPAVFCMLHSRRLARLDKGSH